MKRFAIRVVRPDHSTAVFEVPAPAEHVARTRATRAYLATPGEPNPAAIDAVELLAHETARDVFFCHAFVVLPTFCEKIDGRQEGSASQEALNILLLVVLLVGIFAR